MGKAQTATEIASGPETEEALEYLSRSERAVNRALNAFLPKASVKPQRLHQAMRYSLFAGGKRVRPALCLAAAEACGGDWERAMPAACAVECVHTYSLIHDDLPAMDDDPVRRGKPANHIVFGEGIAVLAGDALLTIAFEILAQAQPAERYSAAAYVAELARAAGSQQLVGGQAADLEAEGKTVSLRELRYIHERKTSALLACSVRLGAMSANASPETLALLSAFGRDVGLAFQVIDDILDVTQPTEKLGKTAGKDAQAAKATYPALLGLDGAYREARRLTARAFRAIEPLGSRAAALRALAKFILNRDR